MLLPIILVEKPLSPQESAKKTPSELKLATQSAMVGLVFQLLSIPGPIGFFLLSLLQPIGAFLVLRFFVALYKRQKSGDHFKTSAENTGLSVKRVTQLAILGLVLQFGYPLMNLLEGYLSVHSYLSLPPGYHESIEQISKRLPELAALPLLAWLFLVPFFISLYTRLKPSGMSRMKLAIVLAIIGLVIGPANYPLIIAGWTSPVIGFLGHPLVWRVEHLLLLPFFLILYKKLD